MRRLLLMRGAACVLTGCSLLLTGSVAAAGDEALRGVAVRLLSALEAKPSACPPSMESWRPGHVVSCGTVSLELGDFKSTVDKLMEDPSVGGGEAVPAGAWQRFRNISVQKADGTLEPVENFDRRAYKLGGWTLKVSYYPGTKTAVVFYPVPFDTCRAEDAQEEPEGLVRPVAIPESKKPPLFPEIAREARLEAVVYVRLTIAADGTTKDACILKVAGASQVGFE